MIGLDAFRDATKADPLCAAEGLDLESASRALDALVKATSALEDVYAPTHFRYRLFCLRYPLAETLYPLSFLRGFLECERARRAFLAEPTALLARSLAQRVEACASALQKDVDRFQKAHETALSLDRQGIDAGTSYCFLDGVVTAGDILASLDQLGHNASVLRAEARARTALLTRNAPQRLAGPLVEPIECREAAALSSDQLLLKELEERNFQMEVAEKFGPISYRLSAFDGAPTSHTFFVYFGAGKSGNPAMRVLLADRHLFLDLKNGSPYLDKDALFSPLIERGIPYWFQPLTSFYMTRDISYYADLATIVDLMRRPLPQETLIAQRSSLLDRLLWEGAVSARRFIDHSTLLARSGKLPLLFHLFAARSHSSLYYLPFNRSVWRLPERPSFPGVYTSAGYLSYDAIRSSLTPELLEQIFAGGKIRREGWNALSRAH